MRTIADAVEMLEMLLEIVERNDDIKDKDYKKGEIDGIKFCIFTLKGRI